MAWTDDQTLEFIEMYRARPVLWDSTSSGYKNINRRHDGLMEICVSFGIDKQEVERKIKNLQSHFSRERKKEVESKKTGSGADEPYVSKWFVYHAMMFLAEKNKPRNTADNVENSIDHDHGLEYRQEEEEGIENEQDQVSPQPTSSFHENQTAKKTPTKRPKAKGFKSPKTPKTKSHSAPIINEEVNLMRSIQSKREDNKDEYSLYGEQVEIKLRKLATPRARFMVQNIINQALSEAEMGTYDHCNAPTTAVFGFTPSSTSNMRNCFSPTYQSPTGIVLNQAQIRPTVPSPGCSQSSSASIVSDCYSMNNNSQHLINL